MKPESDFTPTALVMICTFSGDDLFSKDFYGSDRVDSQSFIHDLAGRMSFRTVDEGSRAIRVEWIGGTGENEGQKAIEMCEAFFEKNGLDWLTLVTHCGCQTESLKLVRDPWT